MHLPLRGTAKARAVGLLLAALLAVGSASLTAQPVRAAAFVVNQIADDPDLALGDGVCDALPAPGAQCTLRAAIQEANATTAADTISFQIPGSGQKRIRPITELPPLTEAVTINGYSQPGASVNTRERGTNAVLRVVLDGANAVDREAIGLRVAATNTLIRGLVINRWAGAGVRFEGQTADASRIAGCFIGTDASGMFTVFNGGTGVLVATTFATIGGDSLAARNLISGNDYGLHLEAGAATGARIVNNLIGTDKTGAAPLSNGFAGILIQGPSNQVGGGGPNEPNTIAYNGRGVYVIGDAATGNRIPRNAIYANDIQGIELALDGPTANDPQDPDLGPNRLQNFPVIASATSTTITGTLNSRPSRDFAIRFYSNPAGGDQGQTFRGGPLLVTTDANGDAPFTFATSSAIPVGHTATATATDVVSGDTSEFSMPAIVTTGGGGS